MNPFFVPIIADAGQILLGAMFILAGLSKLVSVKEFHRTLHALRIAPALVGPMAAALVLVEIFTGTGLLVMPTSAWPRVLVVILGIAFAVAGLTAVASKRRIRCNCIGQIGSSNLGWRQVQLLPAWLALAAVAQAQPPRWSSGEGALIVCCILSALVLWQMARERRLWRELQGDRMAVVLPCDPKSTATLVEAGTEVAMEVGR